MSLSAWGGSPGPGGYGGKREREARASGHSWRGPERAVKAIVEEAWPELSAGGRRRNGVRFSFLGHRGTPERGEAAQKPELDDGEYPGLGQRLAKRKLSSGQNPTTPAPTDLERLQSSQNGGDVARKCCKKPRRTDLICIDLQRALERSLQVPQARSSAKTRLKVRNLNVNITVRNPLDSTPLVQAKRGKQREIPKAKKASKLKQAILQERELKRQMNIRRRELFELQKMQAMTRDVSQIDFGKLKITADPRIDADFVKGMSKMTLFGKEYRSPRTENVPDDALDPRADVVKKLQDLLLGSTGTDGQKDESAESEVLTKSKTEPIDSDVIDKTLCLTICDETGETLEELSKAEEIETKSEGIRHSKSFREYCTNMLTPALNAAIERFLSEITRLQRRLYERDEAKGRCKRRFYAGLKEVEKHIELKKVQIVIVAPDLERIESEGGLDESVQKLMATCRRHEVVFCFALSRRKLGYLVHKKGSVSCIGVANYSGTEMVLRDVLSELAEARNMYKRLNGEASKVVDLSKIAADMLVSDQINSLVRILTSTSREGNFHEAGEA